MSGACSRQQPTPPQSPQRQTSHMAVGSKAVKTRQPVTEDAVFGNNAALACHMANESYFRKGEVTWDAASGTIK